MRRTLLATLFICSCGPAGPLSSNAANDFGMVYLYLLNAYPGASTMKVKTSQGTLATDVGFGERAGHEGDCPAWDDAEAACIPTYASRTDGIFETKFDSERGSVDLQDEVRAMYPQETATIVFTEPNRGVFLRHPQTISSSCGLNIVNALAVEDVASEDPRFDLAVEFERTPADAGFLDEANEPFIGPCGPLPTDAPEHEQLVEARALALAEIAESPWFVPVQCAKGGPGLCFAWGRPGEDRRAMIGAGGTVEALRDSRAYYDCVENALSRAGACGEVPGWADVSFDARTTTACAEPVAVQTPVVPSGGVQRFEGENLCDVTFRARTVGRDLVFGPQPGDDRGTHSNGELIETTVASPIGSDHFWVLYGRPVNPRIWQWDSSETFVDLELYPYPGE